MSEPQTLLAESLYQYYSSEEINAIIWAERIAQYLQAEQ